MGWTQMICPPDNNFRREVERLFKPHPLLGLRQVGSQWFGVFYDDDLGGNRMMVVITETRDGLWSYKEIGEWMGPASHYAKCPNSLLDMLPETDCEYTNRFRAECRAYNARPKPEYGQTVRTPHPISIEGVDYHEFTRVRYGRYRNVYRTEAGTLCRLSTTDFIGGSLVQ